MIGAYRATENFAYPGWRLTVPGGPAGGHYKGFTHTEATGTDIPPNDQYEMDREDGMSSHDPVHASLRNPRGVYRSSGEVPPRPNASGAAMTYRGFQTARHPGTSIAPGSFPAPFEETDEDAFLSRYGEHASMLEGLGLVRYPLQFESNGGGPQPWNFGLPDVAPIRPQTVACGVEHAAPPPGYHYEAAGTDANGCTIFHLVKDPQSGATSVVNQPPATPAPLPPSPSVPVYTAPPVSPTPAPIVATNEVVPLNDGSGNYVNVSTGAVIPASAIAQNPATGQLTASSALSWLEQNTLWSALPNWGVLAGGAVLAMMLFGKRR
jgi:hypothetical protein